MTTYKSELAQFLIAMLFFLLAMIWVTAMAESYRGLRYNTGSEVSNTDGKVGEVTQ